MYEESINRRRGERTSVTLVVCVLEYPSVALSALSDNPNQVEHGTSGISDHQMGNLATLGAWICILTSVGYWLAIVRPASQPSAKRGVRG